jgi:hypothetical protein
VTMRDLDMQISVCRSVSLARGTHDTHSNDVGLEGSVWQNAHMTEAPELPVC